MYSRLPFTCAYYRSVVQRLRTLVQRERVKMLARCVAYMMKRDRFKIAESENLSSQPNQQDLLQTSGVCMSQHEQGDSVCAARALSSRMCIGGSCASQTVCNDPSQQSLSSEMYRSKQSDVLLKPKALSECGDSACASVNMHRVGVWG